MYSLVQISKKHIPETKDYKSTNFVYRKNLFNTLLNYEPCNYTRRYSISRLRHARGIAGCRIYILVVVIWWASAAHLGILAYREFAKYFSTDEKQNHSPNVGAFSKPLVKWWRCNKLIFKLAITDKGIRFFRLILIWVLN